MTYLDALLYGAIQGITEYLPISSSAHLILLPRFLGERDPGLTFDVFLHLGTLAATFTYFWRDWHAILHGVPGLGAALPRPDRAAENGRLSWRLLVLGTLPALAAGALLHKQAETVFRGTPVLVGTLAIGGLLLWAVDHFRARRRDLGSLSWKDALLVGIIQCLALVPGMSRSGSTITGARVLGFDRAAAARFSFLLSAPVTAAAIVFELRKWRELLEGDVGAGQLLVAGVSAFLFGLFAIGGLLRLIRRFGYLSFAIYRVALAFTIFQVLGH